MPRCRGLVAPLASARSLRFALCPHNVRKAGLVRLVGDGGEVKAHLALCRGAFLARGEGDPLRALRVVDLRLGEIARAVVSYVPWYVVLFSPGAGSPVPVRGEIGLVSTV